jgi:hypothetical protein
VSEPRAHLSEPAGSETIDLQAESQMTPVAGYIEIVPGSKKTREISLAGFEISNLRFEISM